MSRNSVQWESPRLVSLAESASSQAGATDNTFEELPTDNLADAPS